MIFFIATASGFTPRIPTTSGRITIIEIDGSKSSTHTSRRATLPLLQACLTCEMVDVLPLPDHGGLKVQLAVDSDGFAKDLPMNPIASGVAQIELRGVAVLLIGDACVG